MEPTRDGKDFIDSWKAAQEELRRCKLALSRAECEVSNSTNALGKWMMPADATTEEKICVWYGDSLIQVTKVAMNTYTVTVRKRGKAFP